MQSQQQADLKLLKSSIKMTRSISQQRMTKKKKLKRLKSACNYSTTNAESSRFKNSKKTSAENLLATKTKKKKRAGGLLRSRKEQDDVQN